MQRAAGIGQGPTMIVMIMPVSLIDMVVPMIGKSVLVVRGVVRGGGRYKRQGTRARGGDNPGELGDQEQSDQQTDKSRYRTK
jgi:hypothetical protein